MAIDFYPRTFNDLRSKSSAMCIKFHVCILVLGLCDNEKSDILISVIIFYRFISINDIISIMLSAKNLVLSVSGSNLD